MSISINNSSIILDEISDELKEYSVNNFEKLFSIHPEKRTSVLIGEDKKEKQIFRFHKSYLNTPKIDKNVKKSYMFSGIDDSNNNEDLPDEFKPYLEYINKTEPEDSKYNQVVINWYENGSDYIEYHSDCEDGMLPKAGIATISIDNNIDEESRNFCMKTRDHVKNKFLLTIPCKNGLIIKMEGDCQKEFRHCVPKDSSTFKRISITFRKFA